MGKKKDAIIEIAKLVDEYKIEDSKRGELCRKISAIIYKSGCVKCVSLKEHFKNKK